jgi:oxygen-independent coproporphyrinogen III oxidase
MIDQYLTALHAEIDYRAWLTPGEQIKTIYFGGGTPGILSLQQLTAIVDHIRRVWDCKYLEELSIELNPDPFEHTLELVTWLTNYYKDIPRVRCSFGVQTFDDAVLKQAGRWYVFNNVRHFLRELREIKQPTNVFNLDFIAFGTRDAQTQVRKEFLANMIASQTFDSYSLYLLELFPGSKWYSLQHRVLPWQGEMSEGQRGLLQKMVNPDEQAIMTEYNAIAEMLYSSWYTQYEVSNRSLAGKSSIHNRVYWNMEPYLWLGTSASWLVNQFITDNSQLIDGNKLWTIHSALSTHTRYTNTCNLTSYIRWEYLDETKTVTLTDHDYHMEKLMLALRTSDGITNLSSYEPYLSPKRKTLITDWQQQELVLYDDDRLILTHEGMKLSNHLITDLLDFHTS